MQKPISKEINGSTWYARKFSLAGVNEMSLAVSKMTVSDTSMSQQEARELTVNEDGTPRTEAEIAKIAAGRIRISMFGMSEYQTVIKSLRLRHSICNADGFLRWKSVAVMEESIDADEAEALGVLVDDANPPKTAKVELEEAEKN